MPKNPAKPQAKAEAPPTPEHLIPTGDLQDDHISFQFAIYYIPQPKKDPFVELDVSLAEKIPVIQQGRQTQSRDDGCYGRRPAGE